MTQGDKKPPRFKAGDKLSASALNSLADSLLAIIRRMYGAQISQPLPMSGKLATTMAAASNFATSPATATVAIWTKDDSGNMVDSGRSVDVVNRFLRITGEIGDIVTVHWIDGEWRVSGIDCGA
jgi:hypothetical protein